MKALHIRISLLAAAALFFFGCHNEEMEMSSGRHSEQHTIQAYFDLSGTRAVLEESEGSYDLLAKWLANDHIRVFYNTEEKYVGTDPIVVAEVTPDGRGAKFQYDVPSSWGKHDTYDVKIFTIPCFPAAKDGKLYFNASIIRQPLELFQVPVYSEGEVNEYGILNATFHHYYAYELLHISNTSDSDIDFSLLGFEGTPWYKEKGSICIDDGFFVVDAPSTRDPIRESAPITIKPGESRIIVSAYVPNGGFIHGAKMVTKINGEYVHSSNTKTSGVELKAGHAYHMYAAWDGEELEFWDNAEEPLNVEMLTAEINPKTIFGTFTGTVTNSSIKGLKSGFLFLKEGNHPEDYVEYDSTFSEEDKFGLTLTFDDFVTIAGDAPVKGTYNVSAYVFDEKGKRFHSKMLQFTIDKDQPEMPAEWNGQIVLERKYLVHSGNEYANHDFSLVFNNDKKLTVGYYDTNYWSSYSDQRHGVYLRMGNQEWYVQPRISDKWVSEKLEVESDGTVRYYSDGEFLGEYTFNDFGKTSEFYLDMNPFGWWTGHYQAMDDFRLTTPFGVIEDDFDRNIFDLNIWERPENPNGVYVEDGVMKAVQKSTNGNYHLKSKAISLVSAPVTPTYDGRRIFLERKYLVHSGNEYAYHDFSLALDNGQTLSISYYDTEYWTSYDDSKRGVFIHMGDQEWYVQPRISDEWVREKLVLTLDGSILYYCNDELIKGIGMSGFDSEGISSLCVTMNPYGWWTGHYQFMDDFKLVTPSGTIEDDFDKNIFDLNIWEKPENPDGVYVEDGVMKTIQKSTNGNYKLKSKAISLISSPDAPDYDEREFVLERKYLVHRGSDYAYPTISMAFNNKQTLKVGYYDTDYWTSYDDNKHGVYIHFENQEWYVQPRISDEWVRERIVVSLSGSVRYYCNGELKKEIGLSTLKSEEISSFYISVNPFGWWTGHYQYMDDFSLTTIGRTIRDNFNDGVLDSSIWETPANPDGVYEADGYVQMHQLRTDQDFTLKSKPIQLPK